MRNVTAQLVEAAGSPAVHDLDVADLRARLAQRRRRRALGVAGGLALLAVLVPLLVHDWWSEPVMLDEADPPPASETSLWPLDVVYRTDTPETWSVDGERNRARFRLRVKDRDTWTKKTVSGPSTGTTRRSATASTQCASATAPS